MPDFDLVVIGGGMGGYPAAIRARQLGMSVALVERDTVGGLCLNWGCIPSKALLAGADLINDLALAPEFGVNFRDLTLDFGAAVKRSRDVVQHLVGGVGTLLAQNGVTLLQGTARLSGAHGVTIEPDDTTLSASNVLLATGATTASLPGVWPDGQSIVTSREALEFAACPESIIVIGGGATGVELAYLFRSYGAEVTIIEAMPQLLEGEDEDVVRELQREFATAGISVLRDASVQSALRDGDHVTVTFNHVGATSELRAEKALLAVGFAPRTEGLGLEDAGVQLDRGWVGIDDFCCTSVPSVWAAGDMTGKLLLAHVAAHQGVTAVEKMAGLEPAPLDYVNMPRAVFCRPQVASLGLTEPQARQRGLEVRIGRFPLRANGKAMASGHPQGFVKVIADAETEAVVGIHAIGHNATDLLGEAVLGVMLQTTPRELGLAVHPHPTLSEALKEAALAVTGEAIHFFDSGRAHGRG